MIHRGITVFATLLMFAAAGLAQSSNLARNPHADQGVAHWRVFGNPRVGGTFVNDFRFTNVNRFG